MPLRAGVDLGGTKIQSVVTDDQHTVLGQARHPTPKDGGPQGVADAIIAAIREALEERAPRQAGSRASASARRARSMTRPARLRRHAT